MHVEQDVEELGAHAAVAEQRVDGVVPLQQSITVGQRLLRLVMGTNAVDRIKLYDGL